MPGDHRSGGESWAIHVYATCRPRGSHAVTATYTPNANYGASTATLTGGVTFTKLTLPSFDLVVSAPSRVFGQTGTLTAQVTGITGSLINAADTVQFQIDGTPLGAPVTATAGVFSIADSPASAVGPHTITAIFSGDVNINGIANTASQAINAAPTATALAASPAGPYNVGAAITFTATVTTVAPAAIGPVASAGTCIVLPGRCGHAVRHGGRGRPAPLRPHCPTYW